MMKRLVFALSVYGFYQFAADALLRILDLIDPDKDYQ